MKTIFLSILLCCLSSEKATVSLSIRVEGVSPQAKGSFYVAVYRASDQFPSAKKAFKRLVQPVDNPVINFNQLPPDTYAVAIFHDANNNGVLDKNLFGVPVEAYGFSNNVRGTFGPPSFSEAGFALQSDRMLKIFLK